MENLARKFYGIPRRKKTEGNETGKSIPEISDIFERHAQISFAKAIKFHSGARAAKFTRHRADLPKNVLGTLPPGATDPGRPDLPR